MAKAKTFASGAVLTAADVNAYLNPDVPAGVTTQSLDWTALTLASGFTGTAAYARIGRQVFLRFSCTTSIAANGAALPLLTVPTAAKPPYTASVAVAATGIFNMMGRVLNDGTVQIRNTHSAAIAAYDGTATWLLDA